MKVNSELDKIYFDPVAKYKENHGLDTEMTIDDQLIRWYDSWQAPPLSRWFTPQDVKFIEDMAISPMYTTHPKEKYHILDEFMKDRGFKTEIGGTNRRFYSSVEFPQFGAKLSTSIEGFKNNVDEFRVQHIVKPYCTKVYDVTQSGAIALDEVGIRLDKHTIPDYGGQIFDIVDIVFKRRGIAMTDIGIATPKQWVLRRNFGPILCDFPSMVLLDPKKCYCTRMVKRGGMKVPCNGVIDFDIGFNKMECKVCGQKYEIKSLMATEDVSKFNATYVCGNNRKGELHMSKVEIFREDENGTIVEEQNMTAAPASSFVDMENAPKDENSNMIPNDGSKIPYVPSYAEYMASLDEKEPEEEPGEEESEDEESESSVDYMYRLTEAAKNLPPQMTEDEEDEPDSDDEDTEEEESEADDDEDIEVEEEESDEDDDEDIYITRNEFDKTVKAIFEKIENNFNATEVDCKSIRDSYVEKAVFEEELDSINANFISLGNNVKKLINASSTSTNNVNIDKNDLIRSVVEIIAPALYTKVEELISITVKNMMEEVPEEKEAPVEEPAEIEEVSTEALESFVNDPVEEEEPEEETEEPEEEEVEYVIGYVDATKKTEEEPVEETAPTTDNNWLNGFSDDDDEVLEVKTSSKITNNNPEPYYPNPNPDKQRRAQKINNDKNHHNGNGGGKKGKKGKKRR